MTRWVLALVCCVALFGISATAASAETTVADNGFRPDPNGFSFENYGNDSGYANLGPAEMQKLFGPGVCVNTQNGCTLTPPAQRADLELAPTVRAARARAAESRALLAPRRHRQAA